MYSIRVQMPERKAALLLDFKNQRGGRPVPGHAACDVIAGQPPVKFIAPQITSFCIKCRKLSRCAIDYLS